MLKRYKGLIILALFLSLCGVKAFCADDYTWDFGQVKEGAVLKHDFSLKNVTGRVLNIKDINTSCGCTTSGTKQKSLKPGESTLIEVKFNSKGYSGNVEQFVYVNTDDLDNPVVKFIIKAYVAK